MALNNVDFPLQFFPNKHIILLPASKLKNIFSIDLKFLILIDFIIFYPHCSKVFSYLIDTKLYTLKMAYNHQ